MCIKAIKAKIRIMEKYLHTYKILYDLIIYHLFTTKVKNHASRVVKF